MKKLFLIITFVALLASLATLNPAPLAIAFVAAGFLQSYKSSEYSYITVLPATMVGSGFTRCQKYLFDWLGVRGNEITKAAVANGKIIWDPVTYYIRYAITGLSGRQKILSASTTKAVGTCNLDKGILPQYYNFCYDRITVRYGSTNTANSTVANFAGYSSVLSSMDPALRNGEIIISLNREVQIETPVIDFGSAASPTGGGAREFDGGILECPKVWVENLQVEVELNFPQAVASAANTFYFVEVAFQGAQARLN
jgi:hypothetical protein